MTNKEILAELKQSYEYLYDIRENGCKDHCSGQLDIENANMIEIAMLQLAEVYDNLRITLDDDECIIEHNGDYKGTYLIGHTISEDYNIPNEDNTLTCADLGYYWYNDKEFLNR